MIQVVLDQDLSVVDQGISVRVMGRPDLVSLEASSFPLDLAGVSHTDKTFLTPV